MSILKGLQEIRRLPENKQAAYEQFYRDQMNRFVLPLVNDFTLAIILFGSLYNMVSLITWELNWAAVHGSIYLYTLSIFTLLVLNRTTALRFQPPLTVYLTYSSLMLISYLGFWHTKGTMEPIFGLFFTMAFVGMTTSSIRHTSIILLSNIVLILGISAALNVNGKGFQNGLSLLSNWYIFMCMFMALTTATFSVFVSRNEYAMQFLLNEKNQMLEKTMKTLKATETLLIQQQKYQALNHMAKGLLHEIINPVNSASQALQYAIAISDDEDQKDALQDALAQQTRISNILTDLRNFTQPEFNQDIQTVPLNELVSMATKFCHRELKDNNVSVELAIGDKQFIACHPSALTQVFVNLILNACSALTARTEIKRQITITSEELDNHLLILFRDNGKGIRPEELQMIMDPFVSDESKSDNMGLGLSICQTIVRHHSGTMSLDSEFGKWTEVTLKLPQTIHVADTPVSNESIDTTTETDQRSERTESL